MVEFGAGGNITQAAEPAGAAGEDGAPGAAGPAAVGLAPTPAATQRRKRKAKGWFCPVCRQRESLNLRRNPFVDGLIIYLFRQRIPRCCG
jgi:hypothetical protein